MRDIFPDLTTFLIISFLLFFPLATIIGTIHEKIQLRTDVALGSKPLIDILAKDYLSVILEKIGDMDRRLEKIEKNLASITG